MRASVVVNSSAMKADYASHLMRSPIAFELFLFSYLISALCLQNINIYKTVSIFFGASVVGSN